MNAMKSKSPHPLITIFYILTVLLLSGLVVYWAGNLEWTAAIFWLLLVDTVLAGFYLAWGRDDH